MPEPAGGTPTLPLRRQPLDHVRLPFPLELRVDLVIDEVIGQWVTLAGATHVTRAGLSVLSTVGLTRLITNSAQQYVDVAVGLAGDRTSNDVTQHGRDIVEQYARYCCRHRFTVSSA